MEKQETLLIPMQYQVVRKIAAGGMGELYIANQLGEFQFQRQVVIKRLHPELAGDALMRSLFVQEAVLSGRFHHPNLVQAYGIAEDHGNLYMVMEYIDGMDLMGLVRAAIARKKFIPLEHALCIAAQVAEGLEAVHSLADSRGNPLRLVHRDVTPSNILITRDGVAKLVDFGVARAQADSPASAMADDIIAGKVNYMAPEALRGEDCDHRVDLFGLGVILYELVLARRLFKGSAAEAKEAILHKPILLPSAVRPGIDLELEKILLKAVEKNPDHRYQRAAELVADIESYASQKGISLSKLRLASYIRSFSAAGETQTKMQPESPVDDVELDFDQGFGEGWGRSEAQGLDASLALDDLDDEAWLELMANPEKLAERAKSRTGRFQAVTLPAAAETERENAPKPSTGDVPAAAPASASESGALSSPDAPEAPRTDAVFWAGMLLLAALLGFAIARFFF